VAHALLRMILSRSAGPIHWRLSAPGKSSCETVLDEGLALPKRLASNRGSHWLREAAHLWGFTTNTGHGAARTTSSVTLPNTRCANPVRPWLVMITRSAPSSFMASVIELGNSAFHGGLIG